MRSIQFLWAVIRTTTLWLRLATLFDAITFWIPVLQERRAPPLHRDPLEELELVGRRLPHHQLNGLEFSELEAYHKADVEANSSVVQVVLQVRVCAFVGDARVCVDYSAWVGESLVNHAFGKESCVWFRMEEGQTSTVLVSACPPSGGTRRGWKIVLP